jgi:hypothetical protein
MKMPAAARPRFDRLLTQPLTKTNTHKRDVRRLLEQLQALQPPPPTALSATRLTAGLLDRMERKTSPLYLRLAHAAARFLTEDLPASLTAVDWVQRRDVVWAVAHSTKNFDLVGADLD